MLATIDAHKLEEWEDKTYMASALITIIRASKKIQGDAKEKQKPALASRCLAACSDRRTGRRGNVGLHSQPAR